jgi:hypothetical protein
MDQRLYGAIALSLNEQQIIPFTAVQWFCTDGAYCYCYCVSVLREVTVTPPPHGESRKALDVMLCRCTCRMDLLMVLD